MLTKWDIRFLNLAKHWSTFSKDPSTKCGCVIARGSEELGFGYNGFPECIEDKLEWYEDRSIKYPCVIHSEGNAIKKAVRHGRLDGTTCYTYPCAPCGECAKELVNWGITKVVAPNCLGRYHGEHLVFDMAKTERIWTSFNSYTGWEIVKHIK